MAEAINRRQFLRGDLNARRTPIRPPWALAEAAFIAACTRCAGCVPVCPEGLIRIGSGGFPELDFQRGGCSFCGACVAACGTGALRRMPEAQRAWAYVVQVADECLAWRGVVCRSCGEQCEAGAIRFRLQRSSVATPQVDVSLCSGCGECIGVCPTRALSLNVPQTFREVLSA